MIDWSQWFNEPVLLGGLLLLGGCYAFLIGPRRAKLAPGQPYPHAHAIGFYAALALFYFAVGSPLDQISRQFLFSGHMTQQGMLVYPVAVLFLLGLPAWIVDPLLRCPSVAAVGRLATHPIICALIFLLTISIWHAPRLYDWALHDDFGSGLQHVMFFSASLFYWWPQLSPSQVLPRRSYATQMLFQFCIIVGLTPLFAYIIFSHHILYPTYEHAPRLINELTAGNDQLLAGVIMKLGGLLAALTAICISFYRWYREQEEGERAL